ncbi:MAG: lipopolysaccharide heptosyltransferase I [Gammaproteobacteria bacterium]|nr:lipopolysaccharide heptosyltransferase I [Gammaproteobacteria bacterium]
MRVLIVKTSSMGDIVHTLPAVTELLKNIPEATIDWVVEEAFVDIPEAHPKINKIIPLALRRWRKKLFHKNTWAEIYNFLNNLRAVKYDYIIDAQGLLKSAMISRLAKLDSANNKAGIYGLDKFSSRGKHISWLYQKKINIPTNQHAVLRVKQLFAAIFNYKLDNKTNYGLEKSSSPESIKIIKIIKSAKPYLVFLHCTTWESKKWPTQFWQDLITKALAAGYNIKLNSGNPKELEQAKLIASKFPKYIGSAVEIMPAQTIKNLINIISASDGVVCVDTGLGHLAAALNKPGVGIYGSTSVSLTSILSKSFINLASEYRCSPCLLKQCNLLDANNIYPPCYIELSPDVVWQKLELQLAQTATAQ